VLVPGLDELVVHRGRRVRGAQRIDVGVRVRVLEFLALGVKTLTPYMFTPTVPWRLSTWTVKYVTAGPFTSARSFSISASGFPGRLMVPVAPARDSKVYSPGPMTTGVGVASAAGGADVAAGVVAAGAEQPVARMATAARMVRRFKGPPRCDG
jgi:hypothetical protein